jgi:iron complex transport system ATP-binding protein
MPTVTVSHHLEELPSSITHALLLRGGQVMDQGPVEEMLTSERISACFGFPIDVHALAGRWAARAAPGWSCALAQTH